MTRSSILTNCHPTLKEAVPGDSLWVFRPRIMDKLCSLKILDRSFPACSPSTLMYGPEIKFYDTKYPTSKAMETDLPRLYVCVTAVANHGEIVGAAVFQG